MLRLILGENDMSDTAEKYLSNGESQSDYFDILDQLRASGAINMFGAPRWLEENYGLNRCDARAVFASWTKSYKGAA